MSETARTSLPLPTRENDSVSANRLSGRIDPGHYVCRWRPLSLVTIISSALLCGGGYWLAIGRMEAVMAYLVINVSVGLIMTLAATAWGAVIALTESARAGSLFIVFPPYMFYYAATRWRWMAQPSILFVCGISLALTAIFAAARLLEQVQAS